MNLRRWIFSRYLDEGEKILHVAHKHIIVLKLKTAKISSFGIIAPAILYLLFPKGLIIFVIWVSIAIIAMSYEFLGWYLDAWLLTNTGVVDVQRDALFDFTSTRIEYHMIEGVSYTIKGFLQTVFNYGTITIDKLGTSTSVVLEEAASPKKLERLIMRYQERYVHDKSIRDHQVLKGMLSDMISYHVQNEKIKVPKK